MRITRETGISFSVITDTVLADGTQKSDYDMRLTGNVLRSHEQRGHIRTGGLMEVRLGPVSQAKVLALGVGDSVVL